MKIGYISNSKEEQSISKASKFIALQKAGCRKIFSDSLCHSLDRPNLELAIDYARARDILVIWHISCLVSVGKRLVEITKTPQQRDLGLLILTGEFSDIEPHSIESKAMLEVLSLFISRERRYTSQRTKDGLERAKTQGQVLGRPSKFEQWKSKLTKMKAMGFSQGEISRNTGLSYNTVKTYLKRIKAENNS